MASVGDVERSPGRGQGAILIVEDDDDFRSYLVVLLEDAGYRTREASDGDRALRLAREERPRLVLLDVQLPGASGYDLCRRFRHEFGLTLPIMFVSGTRTEPYDRASGLLAGADDYVVKPFAPEEFLARVRAVIRRSDACLASAHAAAGRLTRREHEILGLLAHGVRPAEIARRLFISQKTVGTHLERIYGKLGVRSRAEAISVAYRNRLLSLDD